MGFTVERPSDEFLPEVREEIMPGEKAVYSYRDPLTSLTRVTFLAVDWLQGNLPTVAYFEVIPGNKWNRQMNAAILEMADDWEEGRTDELQAPEGLTLRRLKRSPQFDPKTGRLELTNLVLDGFRRLIIKATT